jgi:putative alpha-1,2-mannosidase
LFRRTLDYGFADYSTAQAFLVLAARETSLGNSDAASELSQRAQELFGRATSAYTNLFDKGRGLMVPKNRNGQFSRWVGGVVVYLSFVLFFCWF